MSNSKQQDKIERAIVEAMSRARETASIVFDSPASLEETLEVFDRDADAETLMYARELATKLFGDKSNTYATLELYDYLTAEGADEEEFAADLKRCVAHAKVAFATDAPSPEQVFALFERIFGDDD